MDDIQNRTQILAIANQKGGVGKTTTCVNLAAALVEAGKKVLLVDNDPQANLTSYISRLTEKSDKSTTDELYLCKKTPNLRDAKDKFIQFYQVGLDFIATDKELASVEHYLFSRNDREFVLRNNLQWALGEYDYVFIDNPPSINLLTINALVAADRVLMPVQAEFFSLEGVFKMQETIEMVQTRWNSKLKVQGILPTQVDSRKKLTGEVIGLLSQNFPKSVFDTKIRENSKIAESSGHGKTIFNYAPGSAGAEDYRSLAEEILSKKSN
ncbi:MAG: ParA family protein [Bacteriovoracia bacterium]